MATSTNSGTSVLRHTEGLMATKSLTLTVAMLAVLALGDCSLPDQPNLNGPSVSDYTTITSLSQVQTLATGVLRGDRIHGENEIIQSEIIGRDLLNLTSSEFRWETQLLGPSIDPSGFLGNRIWPFANIRLANIGIDGVKATSVLVPADQASTLGFLRTLKALEFLRTIETRDTTGAPIDVDVDPLAALAPFHCKHDVLAYITSLLDSAAVNLAAGGATFPFVLPVDFTGFGTPAAFLTFNRALAAKTWVYLAFRKYAASAAIDATALNSANTALAASFKSPAASLDLGPAQDYSTNTGDVTNSLFDGSPATSTYFANQRVLTEADAGDQRVVRKTVSVSTVTVGGETSNHTYGIYLTPTAPARIISNKELLLLQAEVNWGLGNYALALAEADSVRSRDGGLTTDTTTAAAAGVLNRILYEKRYSLLFESGDRWFDARQFGKLNGSNPPVGIGMERTYAPLDNIPIPFNETSARNGNLAQTCNSGP